MKKKLGLPLLLFLFFVGTVFPCIVSASPQLSGRRIGEIHISGNRRTGEKTILRIAGIEEGENLSAETSEQIERNLVKSGLFAEQTVRTEALPDGSVRVSIEIEEKWTLLPVPVFFTDGESIMGGLVVIETNLAGSAKQVIGGVMGGTDGLSGFGVYVDPALRQSSWQLTVSGSAGVEEKEVDLPDGSTAYLIDGEQFGVSFGLAYNFSDSLQAGARFRAEEYLIESVEGTNLPGDTGEEQQIALQGRYDGTIPYGSLVRGPLVSFESAYLFGNQNLTFRGSLAWNFPIFTAAGHRGRILAQGGYGDKPFYLEDTVSGLDGFRTLPFGKTFADEYWSLSAGYDLPVLQQDWGALALTAFYERGWYSSDLVGHHDFHGPGGGFRVYIRKLAIPALGLDVAYNLDTDLLVFSVAVGMRM